MGSKRWQTHPGVLLSSMSFGSVYNPALFIPMCNTTLNSTFQKALLPKIWEFGCYYFLFSEVKKKSSEILLLLCNYKGENHHCPPKASSDSSAAFCFIMLLLLILRQITCNPQGKKKKKTFCWWESRDEKVNEFKNIVKILALKALNQMFLFKNDCTVLLFCEYLAPWFKQSVTSCASKIFAPSDTFYYEIGLLNSQESYSRLSCWAFLQLALIT